MLATLKAGQKIGYDRGGNSKMGVLLKLKEHFIVPLVLASGLRT
jgi:hypothetical protein